MQKTRRPGKRGIFRSISVSPWNPDAPYWIDRAPWAPGSGVARPGLCSRRPGDPDALVRARHRLVDDRQN